MGRERTLPELSKMTYSQMRWLAARLGVSVASSEDMDDDTAGVYCETTRQKYDIPAEKVHIGA